MLQNTNQEKTGQKQPTEYDYSKGVILEKAASNLLIPVLYSKNWNMRRSAMHYDDRTGLDPNVKFYSENKKEEKVKYVVLSRVSYANIVVALAEAKIELNKLSDNTLSRTEKEKVNKLIDKISEIINTPVEVIER